MIWVPLRYKCLSRSLMERKRSSQIAFSSISSSGRTCPRRISAWTRAMRTTS